MNGEAASQKTMRDGTSQEDRISPVLEAGYIDVDEMRRETHLALSVDYARILTFFNLKDRPHGDWTPFFESDESVIFALILTTDLKASESGFFTFMDEMAWGMGSGMGRNLYLFEEENWKIFPNIDLAKKIDHWFHALKNLEGEAAKTLSLKIEREIEDRLGKAHHLLKIFLEQYDGNIPELFRKEFHHYRFTGVDQAASVPSPSDNPEVIEGFLSANFYLFHNAIHALKNAARERVDLSLKSKDHSPAIGLYIAFIQLFKTAQDKLNRFSQKHLNFYYNDVLKARPRKRIPDSTTLVFQSSGKGQEIRVTSGTEFIAGTDEKNRDVIYAAVQDLWVNHARIADLRTLYFARNRLSAPENMLNFTSAAKSHEIPVISPEAAGGDQQPRAWPVFGAPETDSEERRHKDAAFGFAVASPLLFLKEGEREITLSIKMTAASSENNASFSDVLEALLKKTKGDTEAPSPPTDAEKQDFFFKVFRQMFKIGITTEKGWVDIEEYLPVNHWVDPCCEDDLLRIKLELSPNVPPITAYSPEIHGSRYETDLPLIRFMINPATYLFPYSLLTRFVVHEIKIDVAVHAARDLCLYNHLGQLDANGPFNPFGPLPAVGSYLIIGNPEMARKQLTRFEIDIEWGDLPPGSTGFESHYRAYPQSFDENIFKARLTTLSGGQWRPVDENAQQMVDLFESTDLKNQAASTNKINKHRRISAGTAVNFFKPLTEYRDDATFAYRPEMKGGFFKLTLAEPEYAFGHKAYPQLLTQTLTENAMLKLPKLFKPVPNAPYTPTINAIAIHYAAASTLNLAQSHTAYSPRMQECFFHIHPFGFTALSPEKEREVSLLPRYGSDGTLFIGLSAETFSGLITLFFHLSKEAPPETDGRPPGFEWDYLVSNTWQNLEKSRIVSDTTSGFLTSGIMTLKIPEEINKRHTVMPEGLFWLRVSTEHPGRIGKLYSVQTQAVEVRWTAQANGASHVQEILPAGTIQSAKVSIPGIAKIDQIIDSFDGRPEEQPQDLKRRLSERLRHKNRATTPWDYERLILEHFPDIYKVKCFENMVSETNPALRRRPGHILIAVIPRWQEASFSANSHPTVNGARLKEIRAFVKRIASPFAQIAVQNPAYEQIQVRCTVKFIGNTRVGHDIDRLNDDISNALSPWKEGGFHAGFGWSMRGQEVESLIRDLDYVSFVSNFSMLHMTENGKRYYTLFDTASGNTDPEKTGVIHPLFPWSIPVPLKRHFIETMDKLETIQPEITGIQELEIGSTFIITQR